MNKKQENAYEELKNNLLGSMFNALETMAPERVLINSAQERFERLFIGTFDYSPLSVEGKTDKFYGKSFHLILAFPYGILDDCSFMPSIYDVNGSLNKNNPSWTHYLGSYGRLCLALSETDNWEKQHSRKRNVTITNTGYVEDYLRRFLIPYLWHYCFYTKYGKMPEEEYPNHPEKIILRDNTLF